MVNLDFDDLMKNIIDAVSKSIGKDWNKIKVQVEDDFEVFAMSAVRIQAKLAANLITEEEASFLMRVRRNALETAVIKIQGMAKVTLEKAINAALKVVGDAFKTATGMALPWV